MAPHSSVLAWRIPGMGEPGGLPSMGSHRVGHNWSDLAAAACNETSIKKKKNPSMMGLRELLDCWTHQGAGRAVHPERAFTHPQTLPYASLSFGCFLSWILYNKPINLFSCILWAFLANYRNWGRVYRTPSPKFITSWSEASVTTWGLRLAFEVGQLCGIESLTRGLWF